MKLWSQLCWAALVACASGLTCQSPELSHLPFCDPSLAVSARVADLLPRLNVSEKISQTAMNAAGVDRLGIQPYNFGGEALHGVWSTCVVDNVSTAGHSATGSTLCPTQYPSPLHMSSSFDRELWKQMAAASALEARALYQANKLRDPSNCAKSLEGCLGLSYYTPNVCMLSCYFTAG